MPMARTRPNSEMLLMVNPRAAMAAKVPMMATGTAMSGMMVARHVCRKTSTTTPTRNTASRSVLTTSLTDSPMNGVVS